MGFRSAYYIDQCTAVAIRWILQNEKDAWIRNYLDDFFGADLLEKAAKDFDRLGMLFSTLGVEESTHKAMTLHSKGSVLGIWFCATDLTMSILETKLCEIQKELAEWW